MNDHRRKNRNALGRPKHHPSAHVRQEQCRWFRLLACWTACCIAIPSSLMAQGVETRSNGVRKRVYVPLSDLETVLNRDTRGVVLSDKEFRELLAAARKNADSVTRDPKGWSIRSTEYDLVFERTRLLIKARVAFTQLFSFWTMVPLSARGTSIESATLDGKPARFLHFAESGQRKLELLSKEAGDHVLLLELSVPVAMVGSDQVAAVGLVPSAVGTLRVKLPKNQHLLVDGLNIGRSANGDYQVPVGGRTEVSLRVTERKRDQVGDALVFANSAIGVQATPGEITWRAATSLQVYGQAVDRLVFSVPSSLEIADVQSSGLESWELADSDDEPGRTTITLDYRQPFQDSRRVTLTGVSATETDSAWSVPNLMLQHVTAHTGHVVMRFPRGTRLMLNQFAGVRRTAIKQPANSKSQPTTQQMDFDVWQEDFNLTFTTQTKQREVTASLSTIIDVNQNGIDLDTVATLESRYAPLFQVDLAIPAEWGVVSATVAGKAADWMLVPREAGTRQVRLQLPQPLLPGQSLQMAIQVHRDLEDWPGRETTAEFELPEVRVLQSQVVDGTYLIKADEDFEVVPQDVKGLIPAFLNLAGERAGFRYQESRFSATLRVSHRPSRISATTLILSRLDPQALRTHWESTVDINGGGVESLALKLPADLGDQLRFVLASSIQSAASAPGILEQESGAVADGMRDWQIKFDRRTKGRITLVADVEQRRNAEEQMAIPLLRVVDADRQSGYIAVEASAEQHLQIAATDERNQKLADVDPADLPTSLPAAGYQPQERIVAAFRYVTPDVSVQLTEDRLDRAAVPTAVADRLDLTSALGQTGRFQHAAVVHLRAVGVQGLRVELPAKSTLWSTVIDDVPIEVRKRGDATFLIPLPKTDDVTATRTLQIFYETQSQGHVADTDDDEAPVDQGLVQFGTIKEQVPLLSIEAGTGEAQPLEVLDREWVVHYPQDVLLVSSSGRFQPMGDLDVSSMFSGIEQVFQIGSPEHILNNLWYVVIGGGLLFLITLSFRRWGSLGCAAFTTLVVLLAGALLIGYAQLNSQAPTSLESYAFTPSAARSFTQVDDAMEGAAEPSMMPMDQPDDVQQEMSDLRQKQEVETEKKADEQSVRQDDGAQQLETAQQAGQTVMDFESSPFNAAGNAEAASQQLEGGRTQNNARLSVQLELPELVNCRTMSFRYLGDGSSAPPTLNIDYANRNAADVSRICVTLAIAFLVFWCQRNRSFRFKAMMSSLGTTVPLALLTVTPGWLHVFLDGVFLGALCGTALWSLRSLILKFRRWPFRWRTARKVIVTGASLLFVLLVNSASQLTWAAPQNPASQSAVSPQNVPAQRSNEQQTSQQSSADSDDASFPQVDVTSIVIPYEDGQDPLDARRVYLPIDQFLRLWRLANPGSMVGHPKGHVDAAIYRAELQTAPGAGSRIHVTGRLVLHTYHSGQVAVELPLGRVALSRARLDGQPAPVRWATPVKPKPPISEPAPAAQQAPNPFDDQPPVQVRSTGNATPQQQANVRPHTSIPKVMTVLVSKPGAHVLDLEFDVPVQLSGPAGQFQLPLKRVPTGKLTFVLPADDLLVRVNNATNTYRIRSADQRQLVEIPIDAGGDLSLAWQPKQTRGPVDLIVHSSSATAVMLDDSGTRIHSGFDFQVRQGAIAEVTFSYPNPLNVQKIRGADVGGWQIEGDGEQRQLKVFLRRTVRDSTQIVVDLYQQDVITGDGVTIPIAQFAPLNMARDTGLLGVFAKEQLVIRGVKSDGLRQIDTKQYQPNIELTRPAEAPRLAYRYVAQPVSLQMNVARQGAVTRVDAEQAALVEIRNVRLTSRFQFDLQGTPRSRVAVQLPVDYLPLSVDGDGLADWYVSEDEDDAQILIVETVEPRVGALEIVVQGTVARDPDDEFVEIDMPYPLEVTSHNTRLAVWIDPLYAAVIDEIEGWKSMNPSLLSADQRRLISRPAQFAFRSNEVEVLPVALQLTRNVARMTGDVVTVVNVYETSIEYSLNIKWQVQRSSADTFVFTTPAWLKDRVDVQCEGLRQVESEETDDGQLRWTLTLREPRSGEVFAMGTATLPPAAADSAIQAPIVSLRHAEADDEGEFTPLATQRQFVMLLNQSPNQLVPDQDNTLSTVDPAELPIQISEQLLNAAAQIGQLRGSANPPRWNVRALQKTDSAPASVNLADVVTVVAEDGGWRTVARYNTKNRSRQFLPVVLPADVRLLSVFVKGTPARPVKTQLDIRGKQQQVYLVALPKTSAADLPFDIRLVMAGSLPKSVYQDRPRLFGQEIQLPVPRILSLAENEEFGIPVIRTRWKLHLPNSWEVRAVDDRSKNNMTQEDDLEAEALDQLAVLSAANDLFVVLRDKQSSKLKYRAWSNVYQLENALQSSPSYSQSGPAAAGGQQGRVSSQVAREREKLRRNLEEFRGKIQIDEDNKRAIVEQQSGDLFEGLEEESLDIERQNRKIFGDNSRQIIEQGQQELTEFNFGVRRQSGKVQAKEQAKKEQEATTRSSKLGTKGRQRNQDRSLSQLSKQNLALENRRAANTNNAPGQSQGFLDLAGKVPSAPQSGKPTSQTVAPPTNIVSGGLQLNAAGGGEMGGGMGGGMGGMGGGGFGREIAANQALNPQFQDSLLGSGDASGTSQLWTVSGGLSLEINVPEDGQQLTFTKVSGAPELTLKVWPRSVVETGFGLIWTIVWLTVGCTSALVLSRSGLAGLMRHSPKVLLSLGLVAFFILPQPLHWAGFALFLFAGVVLGIQYRRAPQPA